MSNYTEGFTSVTGDTVDAAELEGEFDKIATAVNSKLDSDGTGTMSGDLNMGNNDITNVSDPSNAQDAATKNYVDTGIVSDYSTVATGVLSTTESSEDSLTVTIPSSWNTYVVDLMATFTHDLTGSPTGDTTVTWRWRETNTSGTVRGTCVDILNDAADYGGTASASMLGYETAATTTGSRTWVLTAQLSGNSGLYSVQDGYCRVLCYRLT